jgi:hypothetical protein
VKRLIEWLRVHHDSPIVLLVMKTVVEALNANQLPTALRVIEVAICSYFRGMQMSVRMFVNEGL